MAASTEEEPADQAFHTADTTLQVPQPHGSMSAFLAAPRVPWKSAVIVLADGPGLSQPIRELCRALAREGCGAVAPDLFSLGAGRGKDGLISVWTTGVDAALAFLRAEGPRTPRFGIVGFGIGGFVALLAGYRCQLGAAVSFYGHGVMQLRADLRILDGPKPHSASLLCLVGANDGALRPEDVAVVRERLTASRVQHSFVVYPRTKNNFFFPGASEYRAEAAADAWKRLLHALDTAPRPRFRFTKRK